MMPRVIKDKPPATISQNAAPGRRLLEQGVERTEHDDENADVADGLAHQTPRLALIDHDRPVEWSESGELLRRCGILALRDESLCRSLWPLTPDP